MNIKNNLLMLVLLATILFAVSDSSPPIIPELQIVVGHEKVILNWDDNAESSIDPFSYYSDFEGYRIYRSTDGGITWGKGESDKIYDYNQNFVGWKPYAQFDLISELDSTHCVYTNEYFIEDKLECQYRGLDIQGYDPIAKWINLGDNAGIKRQFVDEDILDGVEYTYAVTAYDMGMVTFSLDYVSEDPNSLTDNYCSDNDSFCDGQECCSSGSCCFYDMDGNGIDDGLEIDNKTECEDGTEFGEAYWYPSIYIDKESCEAAGECDDDDYTTQEECEDEGEEWEDAGLDWQTASHGLVDYTDKEKCEVAGHEWKDVEYSSKESCEDKGYIWNIIEYSIDTLWSVSNPDNIIGYNYGIGNDELWGYPSFETARIFESFSDLNLNGVCDYDEYSSDYEPFIDEDSSDTGLLGKCDMDNDWTSRCPVENQNCINIVVAEPGYKASNYTEPSDFPEQEFIVPDSTLASPFTNKTILNRGNGSRYYNIVNENDLSSSILRFEINAGLNPDSYGDEKGSFPTLDPKLYIYEISENLLPKNTWQLIMEDMIEEKENLILSNDSQISDENLQDSIDYYIGFYENFPGAIYSEDSSYISIPEYKLDGFSLIGVDNPQFASHYNEWFDGIQFRFDNGPNRFTNTLALVELKSVEYSDTLMSNHMTTRMRYKNLIDLTKRLMYRYRVEFSSSFIDTALQSTGDCPLFNTQFPFRIININTDQKVGLEHLDGGMQIGEIKFGERTLCPSSTSSCSGGADELCFDGKCRRLVGFKNCQWEYNEIVVIVDSVYSTNPPPNTEGCRSINLDDSEVYKCEEKVFELKMGFNKFDYILKHIPDYFQMDGTIDWCLDNGDGICTPVNKNYISGEFVIYEEMLYVATETISETINPALWYDETGDNINDNPWQILYPWDEGESVVIEPYGWYQDGDAWIADLSRIGRLDSDASDNLDAVSVVPNPYIVNSGYFNESPGNSKLRFTRLPSVCTVGIYTISGEFVTSLKHDNSFSGNEWWDLKNGQGEEIAPGLYIYVVTTPGGDKKLGKFAVVR